MRYRIDYPEDWIGIPEFGEGHEFATPEHWARVAADFMTQDLGLFSRKKERRASIAQSLAFLSNEIVKSDAHAGYVWFATLDGPVHMVAVTGIARSDLGDATAAEIAGADRGDEDYAPPIVHEIVADGGAQGVSVERHSPWDEESPHVPVISGTYAFESAEGIVLLQSSMFDLAAYERFRPNYERFVKTFLWDDTFDGG